ncbi:MAG: hypothetical protein ABSE95_11565 [Thermodesulfobacteriota bacterium]
MVKRILSMIMFFSLMACSLPLVTEENLKSAPKMVLNPTVLNVGNLVSPEPVTYSVAIKNLGESLLHISKIKYY